MRRIRSRLTYANVVSTLCLILLLGGGTALASLIITKNSQVDKGTISGHHPPSGDHPNIIGGSINGKDIADRSGVDTCKTPLTEKLGPICAGSDGGARKWHDAINYCASYGLRLPSYPEAVALAKNYDVPGVGPSEHFWSDETLYISEARAYVVSEDGSSGAVAQDSTYATVCVTDPSA